MWGFSVWMALLFFSGNTVEYNAMVAAGAPCVVYYPHEGESPSTPPPVCWYDPTNTNYYVTRIVYE